MINSVSIIYFSGTGGTERIAAAFSDELRRRGCNVEKTPLDCSKTASKAENHTAAADMVILLFAVHAFDAPKPVYDWISRNEGNDVKTAVISVSGGGEAWPNTGCRNDCCKAMEKHGFKVIYDGMMVMPSNWVVSAGDHAAVRVIEAIPGKVNKIIERLFKEEIHRSSYKKSYWKKLLSASEKKNSGKFPNSLVIEKSCTGCGWCSRNCPVGNITMADGRPVFENMCVMCFRCVYGCPGKSISTKNFMVLKKGYDIDAVQKRMQGVALEPVEKCCGGIFWTGIRKYLSDNDGL